jgi:hypothetical protein
VLNKADNDRKGDGADEELEQHTLQERPPANGAERFRREPCPDQKQRERQTVVASAAATFGVLPASHHHHREPDDPVYHSPADLLNAGRPRKILS